MAASRPRRRVRRSVSQNNLHRDEAAARAALLTVQSYDVELDLTDGAGAPGEGTFRTTTVVRFTCAEPGAATYLDLTAPAVPRLVLQGSRDTFGGTAEVAAALDGDPGVRLVDLPGADHGYRLVRGGAWSAADLRETLVAEVDRFVAAG